MCGIKKSEITTSTSVFETLSRATRTSLSSQTV